MFYFFFIRPQSTEQKKRQAMLDGIKKNDEVVTSGGIYGTIVNIKDKTFTLRIDDNVKIEIDKNAVGHVVVKS
jgi:preprotein translocase subunit YajC